MILPSFLEYSGNQLQIKMQKVCANIDKFQEISGQNSQKTNQNSNQIKIQKTETLGQNYPNILYFHLDFVLQEFAKNRQVMQSLEQKTVFNLLLELFENKSLELSVHLMGENLDWKKAFEFWQNFEIPANWQVNLFVEQKMTNFFRFDNKNLNTFCWFDKDFLQTKTDNNFEKIEENKIFDNKNAYKNLKAKRQDSKNLQIKQKLQVNKKQKVLLMTVFAGISGQKLEEKTQKLALEIVKKNPEIDFILDGGWKIEDLEIIKKLNLKNIDLVSYSSFWQRFETYIS